MYLDELIKSLESLRDLMKTTQPHIKTEKMTVDHNGQWKIAKTGGFGTAMTVGGGGTAGIPFGGANKSDETPKKSKP